MVRIMDYSRLAIKEYDHWIAKVHHEQCLGRFLLWSKNRRGGTFLDVSPREWKEAYMAGNDIRFAVDRLWPAEEYTALCAGYRSSEVLHPHFIPRRDGALDFKGITFVDSKPWSIENIPSLDVPDEILYVIADEIREALWL